MARDDRRVCRVGPREEVVGCIRLPRVCAARFITRGTLHFYSHQSAAGRCVAAFAGTATSGNLSGTGPARGCASGTGGRAAGASSARYGTPSWPAPAHDGPGRRATSPPRAPTASSLPVARASAAAARLQRPHRSMQRRRRRRRRSVRVRRGDDRRAAEAQISLAGEPPVGRRRRRRRRAGGGCAHGLGVHHRASADARRRPRPGGGGGGGGEGGVGRRTARQLGRVVGSGGGGGEARRPGARPRAAAPLVLLRRRRRRLLDRHRRQRRGGGGCGALPHRHDVDGRPQRRRRPAPCSESARGGSIDAGRGQSTRPPPVPAGGAATSAHRSASLVLNVWWTCGSSPTAFSAGATAPATCGRNSRGGRGVRTKVCGGGFSGIAYASRCGVALTVIAKRANSMIDAGCGGIL